MNARLVSIGLASIAGFTLLFAPGVSGAEVIQCESRDYQYQFCATPEGVTRARLVEQRSRSACIEGRSWGYDRRGVWVSAGCEGLFEYQGQGFRPQPGHTPAGQLISCESREYAYNVCHTGRVRNVQIVRQISQAPCIQGQSWGVSREGIWVDRGCEAEFRIVSR